MRRILEGTDRFYSVDLVCDAALVPYYARFGMGSASSALLRNPSAPDGTSAPASSRKRAPRAAAMPVPPSVVAEPPTAGQASLIAASAPLIQERISRLSQAPGLLAFLFVPEQDFTVNPEDAARVLVPEAREANSS